MFVHFSVAIVPFGCETQRIAAITKKQTDDSKRNAVFWWIISRTFVLRLQRYPSRDRTTTEQTLPHKLHSAQYKSPSDRETPGPISSLRFQPIDCELCDIWKINVFLTFREAIERNSEKEKCCLTNLIQRKRYPQQVLNVSSVQRLPEASRLPSNFVTHSISQKEMWNF